MTPERYAAIITDHGESMTLTRAGGGAAVALYGKRSGMPVDVEAVGTTRPVSFDVRISRSEIATASWPEPPRHLDTLTIGGRTYVVMSAQQMDDRGTVYGWKLQVTGVP